MSSLRARFAVFACSCALALTACAPAAAPATSPPRPTEPAKPAAPSAQAKPAPSPAGPAPKSAEWERVRAAAKQEGKLIIYGPTGDDIGKALTQGFQQKYPEIELSYNGLGSSQVIAKLQTERGAGLYNADLFFGGSNTALTALIPGDLLDPIQPYLVGPEADPPKWAGGKFSFADSSGQLFLTFTSYVNSPIAYNPDLVSPAEISSYRDLLDPKWRGKIAMSDPRASGGPGGGIARFLYTEPGLGREYLQNLLSTGIVLSRDERQVLDWVARGQYPLALGPSQTTANELRAKGVRIELFGADMIQEGSYLSSGVGGVGLINKAPHPSAAKVYLDHLLSREGQFAFSQAVGYASRRVDVPRDHVDPAVVPREGLKVRDIYTEAVVALTGEILAFLESVIER